MEVHSTHSNRILNMQAIYLYQNVYKYIYIYIWIEINLSEFRNKMKVMCTHPPHHKQRNTSAATKIKIQKIGITTGQVMAQAMRRLYHKDGECNTSLMSSFLPNILRIQSHVLKLTTYNNQQAIKKHCLKNVLVGKQSNTVSFFHGFWLKG